MSEFLLGVLVATAATALVGMFVLVAVLGNETKRELAACRDKQGILVAEVHGHYACISTNALHTWHTQQ